MNAAPTVATVTLLHPDSGAMCRVHTPEAVQIAKLIDRLPPALRQEVLREIARIRARVRW